MDATIIAVLSGAPDEALATLAALSELPETPEHEVVVVAVPDPALDELLARVEGDVTIVRLPAATSLVAALQAGLDRAQTELVVLLAGHARMATTSLAALTDPLRADPTLAATAAGPLAVGAHGLALRRATLTTIPPAPDGLALASAALAVAAHGEVRAIPGAVVERPADRPPHARTYGAEPELTIVVPTLDATAVRVRACLRAIALHTDVPHQVVLVDNGSPPQGFSAPVNAGLRAVRGAYAVVCNDDVEVQAGWWPPLRDALDAGAPVVFPLTVDGAMREDFAAWCFAVSRDALDRFAVAPGEFLHPELKVWFQDTDLLARLRTAGTPPRLVRESTIRHGLSETVGSPDPALRAWVDARIREDKARFEAIHGAGVPGAAH